MEDTEVSELVEALIQYGLGFLLGRVFLFLDLGQEAMEVIDGHEAIIGVLVEQGLDIRRRFRYGEAEAAPEAEAHSVGLFRHRGLGRCRAGIRGLSQVIGDGDVCECVSVCCSFWDDGLSVCVCAESRTGGNDDG